MSKRNFITQVQPYTEKDLTVDANCNDILFYNSTAATIFVDGFPVASGATLRIEGQEDETNVTKYQLGFNGGSGTVYVIRKKYVS